jgi:hypothetical protein
MAINKNNFQARTISGCNLYNLKGYVFDHKG